MRLRLMLVLVIALASTRASANEKVVDIPTRAGVTQRFLLIPASDAKATVILFAGGHGGLQLDESGAPRWGRNNFLIRSMRLFGAHGLNVAVVDAPSDRQTEPFLSGFRQTSEHVADVKAVIAWLKSQSAVPVWLVGTSRGTQSAGAVMSASASGGGPDGVVLTSTILQDPRGRPVPDMRLDAVKVPVLVVHHEQDACRLCLFRDMPRLMDKLGSAPRKELITFKGGENRGDPCEALSYHGFNGLENDVVGRIATWIKAN